MSMLHVHDMQPLALEQLYILFLAMPYLGCQCYGLAIADDGAKLPLLHPQLGCVFQRVNCCAPRHKNLFCISASSPASVETQSIINMTHSS